MNIVIIDSNSGLYETFSFYLKNSGKEDIINFFTTFNSATEFISSNNKFVDAIIFDIEIENLDISYLTNSISNKCKLIALTSNKDKLIEYINFPYFKRIFLKPISCSDLLIYLYLEEEEENNNNSKYFILHTLSELGFNLNHAGTTYLIEATLFSLTTKSKKLIDIYSFIAGKFNTDPKIIGWSINNAINSALENSDEKKIQKFFKIYDNRKLTAKYIITYFSNSYYI